VLLNVREYLEVQLERAEVLPDGKLGPAKLIPQLPKDAPPVDRKKDPEMFLAWLAAPANQDRVVQPAFYQVVGGDQWGLPGMQVAVTDLPMGMIPQGFVWVDVDQAYQAYLEVPAAERQAWLLERTPEQRRQLTAKAREEELKARPPRPQPQPQQPRTPRGGRNQAQDPRVVGEMYAQASGGAHIPGGPPIGGGGGRPAPVHQPFVPQPMIGGQEVAAAPGMMRIWAHDETVEPGRVYVYRLRVIVRNPMYRQDNLADPAVAKTLDLAQGWSDWSEPVTIATNLIMQFADAILNRDQVRFRVWRWQNGRLNGPMEFTASPGDMIGRVDRTPGPAEMGMPAGQPVDYTTGWSVVDVRRTAGANNARVLLVDEQGRTQTRYLNEDRSNPELRRLEQPAGAGAMGMGG
jgi:hypothetical protein